MQLRCVVQFHLQTLSVETKQRVGVRRVTALIGLACLYHLPPPTQPYPSRSPRSPHRCSASVRLLHCQLLAAIPGVFIVAFSIVHQEKYISLYITKAIREYIMAGEVRQPIDIPSLERYLNQNVPEIKTPLDLKQASLAPTTK